MFLSVDNHIVARWTGPLCKQLIRSAYKVHKLLSSLSQNKLQNIINT